MEVKNVEIMNNILESEMNGKKREIKEPLDISSMYDLNNSFERKEKYNQRE